MPMKKIDLNQLEIEEVLKVIKPLLTSPWEEVEIYIRPGFGVLSIYEQDKK